MQYRTACLTALVLLIVFCGMSHAHRVNIFAFVDGDAIQVECSFSKSQKVRHGQLVFTDLQTGAPLLKGTTDEQGMFRFQPDAAFLKTGHGLTILLNAGEGHQNTWQISPEELTMLSSSAPHAKPVSGVAAPAVQDAVPPGDSQPRAVPLMDTAELEALIARVMDIKLSSIKQSLARQETNDPSLKDIIGGIGWIIGLLGLATYMKYRR